MTKKMTLQSEWNYRFIMNTAAVLSFILFSAVKGRSISLKESAEAEERAGLLKETLVPYISDKHGQFISHDINQFRKLSAQNSKHKAIHIVLNSVRHGRMVLKLHPREKLVSPSAVLEWTTNNVTFSKAVEDDCKYYHGHVMHSHGSFISLGICHGLLGVITVGDKELHIEPLHVIRDSESSNGSLHMLYEARGDTSSKQCLQDQPGGQAGEWTKQWKRMAIDQQNQEKHRNKRSTSGHRSRSRARYLETLVVADSSVVDFHGREKVEQYLMSQMNIVDLVYHHASLGGVVNVVVTKILFMDKYTADNILVERDARITLDNFCNWMNDRGRHGYDELGHHDMAVFITRVDLGPAGYAPVTGMCNPARSCSVTRDDGLSSAFVIAHEIAHIFGVHHDSYQNNCTDNPETGALMTTTVRSTFDRYYWSQCSREKFLQHIESLHCLDDTPSNVGHETKVDMKTPLGLNWGLDDQCRQEFGDEYVLCRAFQNLDPCNYLWCSTKADPYMCKTKRIEPLPGTPCDYNKWCMNRKCTYITSSTRDGGWSSWGSWDRCSRSCGGGIRTRYRKCDNPEPTADGNDCPGDHFEEQLCNRQRCRGEVQDFRAEQCSRLNAKTIIRSRRHTWNPIENEDSSLLCKLTCISGQTNDVIVSKEDVIDGTFCSYESPQNLCIKGKCKVVGCDGIINSIKKEDKCGVCDGDNSSCRKVIGHFRKAYRRGVYNQLVTIPRGARHIEISRKRGSRSFIAKKKKVPTATLC